MKVAVLGLGYVGCVTAACLARNGHDVIGVDVDGEKVALIGAGRSPIIEPGLDRLLADVVREGRLTATTDLGHAISVSEIALICVGTPDQGHGQQDLSAIGRVADGIAAACVDRTTPLTVALRSTVLPGTMARVLQRLTERGERPQAPARLAVNPEFMREGSSIDDFRHPPFVIVGSDDPAAVAALRELYAGVEAPFVETSVGTAEMVKYACNAYHALKVGFANEIAELCDALGADGQEVMRVVCEDRKLNVSPAYLRPGFAFGGSCLPKDLRALLYVGRVNDVPVPLLSGLVTSNDSLIRRGVEAVLRTRRRRIGMVGLAFKPTSDDLRESPMVALAEALIGKGCDVRIYDPTVVLASLRGANRRYIESEIPHIGSLLCDDLATFLSHAEVLVFGTSGHDAARIRIAAGDRTIVDLTHGALANVAGARLERDGTAVALSAAQSSS
jgi:GDP-mannose 6-dehydrogenase